MTRTQVLKINQWEPDDAAQRWFWVVRLLVPLIAAVAALAGCGDAPWGDPPHTRGGIPITRPEGAMAQAGANPQQPTSIPVKEFPPKEDVAAESIELPADTVVRPAARPANARRPVDLVDLIATQPATPPATTQGGPTTTRSARTAATGPGDDPLPGRHAKEVFPASMLQVNNQYISIDEIVRGQGEQLKAIPKGFGEERFRKRAAEILAEETRRQVSECLVLTEASRRIDDEQKKRIDQEMDSVLRQMIAEMGAGSKKKLEQVLVEQGTTLDTVLANHRRHVTVAAYMHHKLQASVRINRTLLWDYYTRHQDEFTREYKVRMQTITVPFREFLPAGETAPTEAMIDSAKKRARERIEKAAGELKAGKKFADAAMAYSKDSKAAEGGLWPAMPAGSFRDTKVEAAAFALPEGQVSEIVEGLSGYTLVKAAEVQGGKTKPFEEAQADIENKLRDQQERALTEQYFTQLLENSTVVQYNKFLERAVDRAVEQFFKK